MPLKTLLIEFMAKKSDVQDERLMMGGGSCTATGTHRSPHRGWGAGRRETEDLPHFAQGCPRGSTRPQVKICKSLGNVSGKRKVRQVHSTAYVIS